MNPNTLWKIAEIIENVHDYVVTPGVFLSLFYYIYLWKSRKHPRQARYFAVFVYMVLGLQAAYLNCPLLVFSHWLRSFKNPFYDTYQDSWVNQVYETVGPLAAAHWLVAAIAFAAAIWNLRMAWKIPKSPTASS